MCKVCQEKGTRTVISRGGKTCKQFTTTNLRNHLRKHPKEFLELSADEKERNVLKVAKGKRMLEDMDLTKTTIRKKLKTQISLQQSIDTRKTLGYEQSSSPTHHKINR